MCKHITFQELVTKAFDMEVTITNHCSNPFSYSKSKKDKDEFKRNVKFSKNLTKEVISIAMGELLWITWKPKLEDKKSTPFKDATTRHPMLKELQENKCHFLNSDLAGMLDDLLIEEIIELPESKWPIEVGRIVDAKYFRYHRIISHSFEKYIMLKKHLCRLPKMGG